MRLVAILPLLALACAGCSNVGGRLWGPAPDRTTTQASAYLERARAGDRYEIDASRSVLTTTDNPDIQSFARMMIDHHTLSTQQLIAAAEASGMAVPPQELDAMRVRMITPLQTAMGETRDAVYLRQQSEAHQRALALHQGYARTGDNAALRAVAAQAAEVVQEHIGELQRIGAPVGR